MIIPEFTKVIVVDDKPEEAEPLLEVLFKNKISALYYKADDQNKLPTKPLIGIRILFLDFVLDTGITTHKNKISKILSVIKKIVSVKNGPYILILWSRNNEQENITSLKEELKKQDLSPILTADLEKSQYLTLNSDGKYAPKANAFTNIDNKLNEIIKASNVIRLCMKWEDEINRSAIETVNAICSTYPDTESDWNKKMSGIIYKLAEAYGGKQIDVSKLDETLKSSLLALNGLLIDQIEENIVKEIFSDYNDCIDSRPRIDTDIVSKLNSKLLLAHISPPNNRIIKPGYLFELTKPSLDITELTQNLININGEAISASSKTALEQLQVGAKHIVIEVSPLCDYAQNKWKLHRVLYGFLWPTTVNIKHVKRTESLYISAPIWHLDKSYYIIVDMRYFRGLEHKAGIKPRSHKPLFRLREQLLVHIQASISKHINRPGVTFISN